MTMKGTASMISVVQWLVGRQVALDERGGHAHREPDATATGRLRSLAAMTAAKGRRSAR